jgi:hypothetical protein
VVRLWLVDIFIFILSVTFGRWSLVVIPLVVRFQWGVQGKIWARCQKAAKFEHKMLYFGTWRHMGWQTGAYVTQELLDLLTRHHDLAVVPWLPYLLTYSMEHSPSREADQFSQLTKKFPAFYGTRRFFAALTSARHLSLS